MSKELSVVQDNQVIDYRAKATEWLSNMGTKLPQQQTAQFLELCQAYKLNPFKREIYAVGYKDKFNIIVGYEVYIKRAERIGKLDGWKCITNENNTKAKITIYRKDWKYPFEHEVLMEEVKQNSPIWQKMPIFMMKKVCIEQGFRLCFPDEMGGMPYGEEEVSYDTVIKTDEELKPAEVQEAVVKDEPSAAEIESELDTDRQKLTKIINEHEKDMNVENQCGNPYIMACKALSDGDPEAISKMLVRVTKYLGLKGIQVA